MLICSKKKILCLGVACILSGGILLGAVLLYLPLSPQLPMSESLDDNFDSDGCFKHCLQKEWSSHWQAQVWLRGCLGHPEEPICVHFLLSPRTEKHERPVNAKATMLITLLNGKVAHSSDRSITNWKCNNGQFTSLIYNAFSPGNRADSRLGGLEPGNYLIKVTLHINGESIAFKGMKYQAGFLPCNEQHRDQDQRFDPVDDGHAPRI